MCGALLFALTQEGKGDGHHRVSQTNQFNFIVLLRLDYQMDGLLIYIFSMDFEDVKAYLEELRFLLPAQKYPLAIWP